MASVSSHLRAGSFATYQYADDKMHIRKSWRGTLIATGALQLSFLLFHIYSLELP